MLGRDAEDAVDQQPGVGGASDAKAVAASALPGAADVTPRDVAHFPLHRVAINESVDLGVHRFLQLAGSGRFGAEARPRPGDLVKPLEVVHPGGVSGRCPVTVRQFPNAVGMRTPRATPSQLPPGAALVTMAAGKGGRRPPAGTELVLEVDDVQAEMASVERSGWPLEEGPRHTLWRTADDSRRTATRNV